MARTKGTKNRSKPQKMRDWAKVAGLASKGWTQRAIAERLGRPRPSVQRDYESIIAYWTKLRTDAVDQFIARDLLKLEALEEEYAEQWERSKKSDENGLGGTEYLQGVERCIEKRAKILRYFSDEAPPVGKIELVWAGVTTVPTPRQKSEG